MTSSTENTSGSELVRTPSTDQLRNLTDFDSVSQLAADLGVGVGTADELGDGFTLHAGGKNKDAFVGKPLIFVSWVFSEGDYRDDAGELRDFVSARVMRRDGAQETTKWIVNDGSTGMAAQLKDYGARFPGKMLIAPRGLRKSEYMGPTGEPSVTYYIDTASSV